MGFEESSFLCILFLGLYNVLVEAKIEHISSTIYIWPSTFVICSYFKLLSLLEDVSGVMQCPLSRELTSSMAFHSGTYLALFVFVHT